MLNDIINKYQLTFKIINSSSNPKIQLASIIDFFKYCEEKKYPHLYKEFIPDFLWSIINIYKNSVVDYIDPYYLQTSKYLLNKAIEHEYNEIIINEVNSINELINIRLLLLYYNLGEIENGKSILIDMLNSEYVAESGVSLNYYEDTSYKFRGKKFSLINPKLFKVNKVFDILRQISYIINKMNSFSSEEVNILLVESDNIDFDFRNFGIVQSLECNIIKKNDANLINPFIENITDVQDESLKSIKNALVNSTNIVLSKFSSKPNLLKTQINLKFRDLTGIYKGTSFGAGASVLIPSSYLTHTNSRIRYSVSCSAAFTGSIDDNGFLLKLPDGSIETKIEAAFFSWIKYVVLPTENLEIAKEKLKELNNIYPRKEINLIGANHILDIIGYTKIIKTEKDNIYRHTRKSVARHPKTFATFLFLILILLTSFIVEKFVPRNIKPLTQSKNYLQVFYTPDRDTTWLFQNNDRAGGDTIFFGEIGIGDMLTHRLEIWNNDYKKQPIRIEVRGQDKEEFEVVWAIFPMQKEAPDFLYPDLKQQLFIKFVPYKTEGEKEAKLVFFTEDNPKDEKIIYLKGKSGNYKGYSLKMKDDDLFIVNPQRGNILGDKFTISFWFKTNLTGMRILNSNNSNITLTKFDLSSQPDSCLYLQIQKPTIEQQTSYNLKTKTKIKSNEWNYVAIVHSINKTDLILNEDVVSLETSEEHFKQLDDFFSFGAMDWGMKDIIDYRNDGWELYFAEIKMFNKQLSRDEILEKKFSKEKYDNTDLILYYDFQEMTGHFLFDKSRNDINGEFFGLPCRSLDVPQLKSNNIHLPQDESRDMFVRIDKKGGVFLYRNIFGTQSSFTIQFEAKSGGKQKVQKRNFYNISGIANTYVWFYENDDSINIGYYDNSKSYIRKKLASIHKKLDNEWHTYTIDYSLEKNKGRFFIDGILMDEYDFGEYSYDITKELYYIVFGKDTPFDNARFVSDECSIDNIAIYNRTLDDKEVNLKNPKDIRRIQGLLGYWTFSNIDGNVAYDEINRMPIFLWDEFEVLQR